MRSQWLSKLAATLLFITPVTMFGGSVELCELIEEVKSEPQKLILSWEDFETLNRALAKKIYESGWDFDQIVCIARGGMFIGDPLSRIFQKPLAVISASSYRGEGATTQSELVISERIAMTTPGLLNRILLVDDLVDSGVTLSRVKAAIQERYPNIEEIKTAVLWRKTGTQYEADYFVDEVHKDTWIMQPFELIEGVKPEDL
jgi:hypoxanthine phosphoribosyltransferase